MFFINFPDTSKFKFLNAILSSENNLVWPDMACSKPFKEPRYNEDDFA